MIRFVFEFERTDIVDFDKDHDVHVRRGPGWIAAEAALLDLFADTRLRMVRSEAHGFEPGPENHHFGVINDRSRFERTEDMLY